MPVVTNLRNPCLKGRHWKQIETIIGQTLPPGNTVNFMRNETNRKENILTIILLGMLLNKKFLELVT